MQRDRARERNERARRQWELEHADFEQVAAGATPGATPGSQTPGGGGNNGGPAVNHIGSGSSPDTLDGYTLVMSDDI